MPRPFVPISNRHLGLPPSDMGEIVNLFMQALCGNLNVTRNQFRANDQSALPIKEMLESNKRNITPLSYIRRRSLQKIFFIIDEAQNLTPHEVKTVITRAALGKNKGCA